MEREVMMTSGGSFSTFISSPGVMSLGSVLMEADSAGPSLSSLRRDKTGVLMQSVSVEKRTVGSESR